MMDSTGAIGWVAKQRRYRHIADSLREAILSGEYRPGDRLPTERTLAQQFNVSRSCVREALLALEIQDLVHIRVGSGVYVSESAAPMASHIGGDASEPSVADILNARLMFQPEMCAVAARNATEDDIHALQLRNRAITHEIHTPDTAARYYRDFHLAIARATHNPFAHGLMLSIWQAARAHPEWEKLRQLLQSPERQVRWRDEHEGILAALAKRHRGEARAAMRSHVENVIAVIDEADML
ncbi:MAG: FadR family transcriptional regulator [Salinarimonas sp.]|nr:FadR family transcriptional regulator [Salinarimonas sp.]